MALPFDILTRLVLNSGPIALLNFRSSCKELHEFLTPQVFKSLRYPCTRGGFSQLHSLGLEGPSDSVQNVSKLQSEYTSLKRLPVSGASYLSRIESSPAAESTP